MSKKVLSLLLALILAVGMIPGMSASAAGKVFHDVPQAEWYAGYVYAMEAEGVIGGKTATRFDPNGKVTRAEYIKMLACTLKSRAEYDSYKGLGLFTDIKGHWAEGIINWGAQEGILTSGGKFTPDTPLTRGEAALMMYRFSQKFPEKAPLTPVRDPKNFSDVGGVSQEIREAIDACCRAGVIGGDKGKDTFRPNDTTKRMDASKMMCVLLGVEPLPKDKIPVPPVIYKEPKRIQQTVAGVGVTGIELDAGSFNPRIYLPDGRLDKAAPASSFKGGAYVAVNGTFFNSYDGSNHVYGSLISNRKILRLDPANAPNKPFFVVDGSGKASIQHMKINQIFTLEKDGKEFPTNGGTNVNVDPGNSWVRTVFTSEFGKTIPGKITLGLVLDHNNKVIRKIVNETNVAIPATGCILGQRQNHDQWQDRVFTLAEVGDVLKRKVEYQGSTTQDIVTAIACGPTVVKDGKAYGNSSTYASEGFNDTHVTVGASNRMAIGAKADGTVVIVNCSTSLANLSQVMLGLGCKDAMNLDGGASTYLYYNGATLVSPNRNLSNLLVFTKKT